MRKMLRNDMDAYKARAEAVRHAEVFHRGCICYLQSARRTILRARRWSCAQAANELLNIVGIKASFVLTEYQGQDLYQRAVH